MQEKNGKSMFFCYEVFDYELNFYYYTTYYIFMYI